MNLGKIMIKAPNDAYRKAYEKINWSYTGKHKVTFDNGDVKIMSDQEIDEMLYKDTREWNDILGGIRGD